MTSLSLEVSHIIPLARNICAYELRHPDQRELPPFEAGAHLEVDVPEIGKRHYSLINDEQERQRYVIAVQQDAGGRGGSTSWHRHVHCGKRIKSSAPRNAFSLVRDSRPIVLIAGGIGITPLRAMIHVLQREGRPYELHYSAGHFDRFAFASELSASADKVRFYGATMPQGRMDIPSLINTVPAHAHVYACGPASMLEALHQALPSRPDLKLHMERFSAPILPSLAEAETNGFELFLARQDRTIAVGPNQSILEALRAQGIEPETSCESGVCGTCLTRVLAGKPDHRDYFLSEDERNAENQMLICVSRAAPGSQLTLDL